MPPERDDSFPIAPPISQDGFVYANGDFYAEAAGSNRHRRAKPAELRQLFGSMPASDTSTRDHPGHWYEAQLMHYGLKPSKTKAVARMRLFDAVRDGNLTVPKQVSLLENELRKNWNDNNNKEARKARKGTVVATPARVTRSAAKPASEARSTSAKRKSAGRADPVALGAPSAKKAKAVSPPRNLSLESSTTSHAAATGAPPRMIQTARRGRGWSQRGRGSPSAAFDSRQFSVHPECWPTPQRDSLRPRQNERPEFDDDNPPREFSRPQMARRSTGSFPIGRRVRDRWDEDEEEEGKLGPIYPLVGVYTVKCPTVEEQWPRYSNGLSLTVTVDGSSSLWARFDLGVMQGVMRLPRVPNSPSWDEIAGTWRGEETEGQIWYGNTNVGWLRFLGAGRIEGGVNYQMLRFTARREAGPVRNPIPVAAMRSEFEGYSEREYEERRKSRW